MNAEEADDWRRLIESGANTRILSFDPGTGLVSCEAGATLRTLLVKSVPQRFFLPATPETARMTAGEALERDVCGMNRHARGSFGDHVVTLKLLRSTGEILTCSPTENPDLFRATIGGMGLTGRILSLDLKLMKVPSAHVQGHVVRFATLEAGFARIEEAMQAHEYVSAWIDPLASGRRKGRGVLFAADHADASASTEFQDVPPPARWKIPLTVPFNLLGRPVLKVVNEVRFRRAGREETVATLPWNRYFHPLDTVREWQRLYGPNGHASHSSVFPGEGAQETAARLIETVRSEGHAAFRAVLRPFGSASSRGILSLSRPGFALFLEFAGKGTATLHLLDRLDDIVLSVGGAVVPDEKRPMAHAAFPSAFPEWRILEAMRDPAVRPDFWARMASEA